MVILFWRDQTNIAKTQHKMENNNSTKTTQPKEPQIYEKVHTNQPEYHGTPRKHIF